MSPPGLASLVSECLFILLVFLRPWKSSSSGEEPVSLPGWVRYGLPAAALMILAIVNIPTYRWDSAFDDGHEHEFSVEDVLDSPELSLKEFEEQYLAEKNEYIRIWPVNIETVSRIPNGVYRNYIFDIVLYFNT